MVAAAELGHAYGEAFGAVYARLAQKYAVPLYPFFLDGVAGDPALEAMAGGVMVVANNVGGLHEILTQGVTGFMGNIGDTDQMARYAIDILKDENTFNQFRANAKKQAENFDITRIVPQYEHLYERLYEGYCKDGCRGNKIVER